MVAVAEERPLGGVQRRSIGRVRRETPRCSSHALPLNALSARPKVFRPNTFLEPIRTAQVDSSPDPKLRYGQGSPGRSATESFGSPDDLKLKSCATLFSCVAPPGSVFDRLLEKYYRGAGDGKTLALLGLRQGPTADRGPVG